MPAVASPSPTTSQADAPGRSASSRPQVAEARIVGRISREPETARTIGGQPICRITVTRKADGPVSSPVVVGLYITGNLARRCARGLGPGDLIEAEGELFPLRHRARFPEVRVADLRLYEEVSGRARAAR